MRPCGVAADDCIRVVLAHCRTASNAENNNNDDLVIEEDNDED